MDIQEFFADLPTLETERLILRKVASEDAEDMFAYASNPNVAEHVTWDPHQNLNESMEIINRILTRYKENGISPWGIVLRSSNKFISTCGFFDWSSKHNRAEIAYAISETYWGQGYTTEAARSVIDLGFNHGQLNRIEARCKIPNIGSARVMEKCGMTFEGILRQHVSLKNQYHDMKLYSILRHEWTMLKSR